MHHISLAELTAEIEERNRISEGKNTPTRLISLRLAAAAHRASSLSANIRFARRLTISPPAHILNARLVAMPPKKKVERVAENISLGPQVREGQQNPPQLYELSPLSFANEFFHRRTRLWRRPYLW